MRSSENQFIMSVDVDSWSSLLKFYSVPHDPLKANSQVNVENGLAKLLNLFEKHQIKATFFVPGEVAQNHKEAISELYREEHEVAGHGFFHEKNECLLGRAEQKQNIEQVTKIIEHLQGVRPNGFRAPCLRANETTLEVLEECGYLYDSSIVPTFVPGYYGALMAPSRPYHPSPMSKERQGSCKLLEIPVSVNPLIPIPFSAAWMRNFGFTWTKLGVKMNFVLRNPVMFYVHPRDVVALPKAKGVPYHLYRNVGGPTLKMLDKLIRYAKGFGARFVRAVDLAQATS